jgi:hypothetical protein
MPTYKLTYFNVRALGELPRLIFAAAGVKFDDCRVKDPFVEWPEMKKSKYLVKVDKEIHYMSICHNSIIYLLTC